jgi:phosphoribosylformimino-5-aminoimidazole carboxamide ribotide isomerase
LTQFRPCIDLHGGAVKQIVGGSLQGDSATTNFVSDKSSGHYAELFKQHSLRGGHVISLGAGNQTAAAQALAAWPGGLQYGGGVTLDNATDYLALGASQVIVTSWLFVERQFSWSRLEQLAAAIGPDQLVLDLSCRRVGDGWQIASDRWQTITDTAVNGQLLTQLGDYCSEFLVHAADVEGLQQGIDGELVALLGGESPIPVTYAGGARSLADLEQVKQLSHGRVDLTIGSALDIFGGSGVTLDACVAWNRAQ